MFARIAAEKANQDFIESQMSTQQQIVRDQDEELEVLGVTISRIGNVAKTIQTEIVTQTQLSTTHSTHSCQNSKSCIYLEKNKLGLIN
jgi:hypothetical protein